MRAFILRRVELIAHGLGDVVLVGSTHSAGTLRIKEFLTRNGHPVRVPRSRPRRRRPGAARSLPRRRRRRAGADLPRRDGAAQSDATRRSPSASASTTRSIRRTCATSSSSAPDRPGWPRRSTAHRRGSTCWSLESNAPGGQAGSSSKIENYLGFPTGISGQELAGRAYTQAQKFGAQIVIAQGATAADLRPQAVRDRDRRRRADARARP